MQPVPKLFVSLGLMSGTSADGVDAAVIVTDGISESRFLGASTMPYADDLRSSLLEIAQNDVSLIEVLRRQKALTMAHVDAVRELLERLSLSPSEIDVIGFHGHTIRHVATEGLTWQIGDPSILAQQFGVPVVHDFRRMDMAAGGQGAPLVPMFHQQLCQSLAKPVAMLNLGGVGNLTWMGDDGVVIATDTGPGCGLLDAWAEKHFQLAMDIDGRLASQGTVDEQAVLAVLSQPFFQRPNPKSADRFEFDVSPLSHLDPHNGLATLCAITARSVHEVVRKMPSKPETLYVTGGGSKHPVIREMLRELLEDVRPVEDLQLRSDSMEAECFAWLAVRRLLGLPTSLPTTTACRVATSGGSITG